MKSALLRVVALALGASMLVVVPTTSAAATGFGEVADPIWMTNGAGNVLDIARSGSSIYVAGGFTGLRPTYNGSDTYQMYVAALDRSTGVLKAGFDPDVNAEVRALGVSPDGAVLFIGGRFTTVNGKSRTRIAAVNANSGNLIAGWSAVIPTAAVHAIVVDEHGDVFIGGGFTAVDGQTRIGIAKLDGATGDLMAWDAGLSEGKVKALALSPQGDRLYLGVELRDENNTPNAGAFLALDPNDGSPIPGFDASGVNRPVFDIAQTSDKLYLALGGGGGAADILRVSDGSRRQRFYTDGDVQAVEVVGDRAYFSGHWVDRFGQEDSFRHAAVDTATDQVDLSFSPNLKGAAGVFAMLHDGQHLWMGGHITDAVPYSVRGFARFPGAGNSNLTPLIDSGATWAYLDDGSQLGSGWRNLGFNDSAWSRGSSELGFGDGGETTVISGGPSNDRHITTYFRRKVAIYKHDKIEQLAIDLLRDDGAVVYLNGVEVIRDNMPSGAINGATLASSSASGTAESDMVTWVVPTSALREGDNIIAVEVHQVSKSSDDLSFDLRMLADYTPRTFIARGAEWRYIDDGSNRGTSWRSVSYDDSGWRRGDAQLGYGDGDETTVIRKGPVGDRHITSYFRRSFFLADASAIPSLELELRRDDGAVVYVNGTEVVRSNLPGGAITHDTPALKAVNGRAENRWLRYKLDPGLLRDGENVVAVEIHQSGPKSNDHSFDLRLSRQASPEVLVGKGAAWRYHDKGKNLKKAWRNLGYNHGKWNKGRAQLGYGDGDERTVVASGPAGDRHITTYFRRKFVVPDADVFSKVKIELLRDDGAVVYINGVRAVRSNMPTGPINWKTPAGNNTGDEDAYYTYTVSASALVNGVNVVAVEVHQVSPGSSDMSFALRLTGK